LRSTFLVNYVPLDQNIEYHRWVAIAMFLAALGHTAAHITDFLLFSEEDVQVLNRVFDLNLTKTPTFLELLLTTIPGITGLLMILILTAIFATALKKSFRDSNFNTFWFVHHLFLIFYALLIIHGTLALVYFPLFWIFFIIPGLIYGVEKVTRVLRTKQRVAVVQGEIKKSNIIFLKMEKPDWFKFKSGQYLFLNWKQKGLEWHPFTISSSPLEKYLTVHIRVSAQDKKRKERNLRAVFLVAGSGRLDKGSSGAVQKERC
jgi:predicted ferric reductase